MGARSVDAITDTVRQLEGGGFPVRRPFPTPGCDMVDPFLLLDEMGPVDWPPGEAIGAPDHPHRGFETVTYVLSGRMEHRDSAGGGGVIGPGDVQWMTAGAGVVHSEMPEDSFLKAGGRMHGFQLWVNLPERDKMIPPRYQGVSSFDLPVAEADDGRVWVRVIAGEALGVGAVIDTRTPITYLHVRLRDRGRIEQPIPAAYEAFAYVFAGTASVAGRQVADGQMARLGAGDRVELQGPEAGDTELLLVAGAPLREPVVRYGPFVMTRREEILQAIHDFQAGRMGRIPPRS